MLTALGLATAVTSVLLVAAVSKAMDRNSMDSLGAAVSALWPFERPPKPDAARRLGRLTLAIEMMLAWALVAGVTILVGVGSTLLAAGALVLAAVLFGVFAAVQGISLRRGQRPVCACFGARSTPISVVGAVRTAVLAILALVASVLIGTAQMAGRVGGLDVVVALCLGAMLGVALIGAEDIADILRPTPAPARCR